MRVVNAGILVVSLELIANASLHMLDGKKADGLIEFASDALEGVEDIGEVGMDIQGDLVTKGISDNLSHTSKGVGRVLSNPRAEGLKELIIQVYIKLAKDVVPQQSILGVVNESSVDLAIAWLSKSPMTIWPVLARMTSNLSLV